MTANRMFSSLPLLSIILVACLSLTVAASASDFHRFDVEAFGAIGDGKTLNTVAFRKAALAAAASYASSGKKASVYVGAGTFVSGAFNLSSGVYLELEENAEIYASDDPAQYVCVPSLTSDTGPCDYPFIAAVDASNTGIVAVSKGGKRGLVNGGANDPPGHLVDRYDAANNFLIPKGWVFPECSGYACRPKLVLFLRCSGVTMQGVFLLNSPLWTVTLVETHDVLVDDVTIRGDRRWPNNDGIDPISSYDIIIQNSWIEAGDDAVAVITHTPTDMRNITVKDSVLISTSAALKLSAFDANATGNIYNIQFTNLAIRDTNRGICIDPRWGTGRISNVLFENITIETRFFSDSWWGSGEPIHVASLDQSADRPWKGMVENIRFVNIQAESENGVVVYGKPNSVRNLTFERIDVSIGVFGNISRPIHDWRPAPPPEEVFALIDGFFFDGVEASVLTDSRVQFVGAQREKYWGSCVNITATAHVKEERVQCEDV